MKWVARKFIWLLPLLLSACVHNAKQAQTQTLAPPIEDTPPPPPNSAPANLPEPEYKVPKTDTPVVVVQQEQPSPPPRHHKPKSTANPAPGTSGQTTQLAENTPPPAEDAIGKLESPSQGPDSKNQTENSITEVLKGLNGINRKLNDNEEKTSAQIKEFLKQAKDALASGDTEGAKNLVIKAKVLLSELSQ